MKNSVVFYKIQKSWEKTEKLMYFWNREIKQKNTNDNNYCNH